MSSDLPRLRDIRHPRHPGISDGVCESYAEAAEVSLSRHHDPPRTRFAIECDETQSDRDVEWAIPDETTIRAWNNQDDATRDGAYIISLAVVEKELGMVALLRAETRTGADYYVGQPGSEDIENAFRLEVSGTDRGDHRVIRRRLREKINQALRGDSYLPAYASIVGFEEAMVLIKLAEVI